MNTKGPTMERIEKTHKILDSLTQSIEKTLSIPLENKIKLWATPFENAVYHFYLTVTNNLPLHMRAEYYLHNDKKIVNILSEICIGVCKSHKTEFNHICDNVDVFYQKAEKIIEKIEEVSGLIMVGQEFFNNILLVDNDAHVDVKSEFARRVIMESVRIFSVYDTFRSIGFYQKYIDSLATWIDEYVIPDINNEDEKHALEKYSAKLRQLKIALDSTSNENIEGLLMKELRGSEGIISGEDEVL